MEKILQVVFGYEMFSLLDVFSRYNHALATAEHKLKTTFCTKWETFPFGLINVRATIQRAIDIEFQGLIN
jgi:hypothetical protein